VAPDEVVQDVKLALISTVPPDPVYDADQAEIVAWPEILEVGATELPTCAVDIWTFKSSNKDKKYFVLSILRLQKY
jgi:hypothetical protein